MCLKNRYIRVVAPSRQAALIVDNAILEHLKSALRELLPRETPIAVNRHLEISSNPVGDFLQKSYHERMEFEKHKIS